jgi:hypothetical protein
VPSFVCSVLQPLPRKKIETSTTNVSKLPDFRTFRLSDSSSTQLFPYICSLVHFVPSFVCSVSQLLPLLKIETSTTNVSKLPDFRTLGLSDSHLILRPQLHLFLISLNTFFPLRRLRACEKINRACGCLFCFIISFHPFQDIESLS